MSSYQIYKVLQDTVNPCVMHEGNRRSVPILWSGWEWFATLQRQGELRPNRSVPVWNTWNPHTSKPTLGGTSGWGLHFLGEVPCQVCPVPGYAPPQASGLRFQTSNCSDPCGSCRPDPTEYIRSTSIISKGGSNPSRSSPKRHNGEPGAEGGGISPHIVPETSTSGIRSTFKPNRLTTQNDRGVRCDIEKSDGLPPRSSSKSDHQIKRATAVY